MKALSCDFARLYGAGGLHETGATGDELDPAGALGSWIASVYPPYAYARSPLERVGGLGAAEAGALRAQYAAWNRQFASGAGCELFELRGALLYDRTLYRVQAGALVAVYETHRRLDRHWKTVLEPAMLDDVLAARDDAKDRLYLGSVGSENYAHWLVDDLARARALDRRADPLAPAELILDGYFPAIDDVRAQTLRAYLGNRTNLEITFIDKRRPHYFPRLLYATPTTYHPFLKSPEAVQDLYERLNTVPAASAPERLFIGRRALWRNLINKNEVAGYFEDRGFTIATIDLDSHTFEEQRRLFARAKQIVAVSGAAMANSIFAPPGATVIYLAPRGFNDPYYWDLAAVKQHRYCVCFGTPRAAHAPEFSSFTVAREQLDEAADWL